MSVGIDINTKRMEEQLDRMLDIPKQMERAVSNSMNTAVQRKGRASIWQEVREDYAVCKADILGQDHVKMFKANPGRLEARLVLFSDSNIPLGHFLRPKKGPKRRPKVGPAVLIKRSSGKKPVKGAFVKLNNGKPLVFKRVGDPSLPIAKLFTSAPIRHLEKDDVQDRIYRDIEEGFFTEVERLSNLNLSKAGF
ncbi:MAG: hypothetical protein JEY79_05550 [Pseudodesulfovibrio sp.]|nr:hypothetical protein [Pseudodesulfovibrio sp.]